MTDDTDTDDGRERETLYIRLRDSLGRSFWAGLEGVWWGTKWTARMAGWAGLAFLLGTIALLLVLNRTRRNLERYLGTVRITDSSYDEYDYDNATRVEFQVSGEAILPRYGEGGYGEGQRIEIQG